MQGQRGLTTGFRAVHLNDAAPGHAAHAQCQIQADAAGRDGIHLHGGVVAQLHHSALAKLLFDLGQCRGQRILLGTGIGLLGRRGNVVVLIFCIVSCSFVICSRRGAAKRRRGHSNSFGTSITHFTDITTGSCRYFYCFLAITQRSLPPKSFLHTMSAHPLAASRAVTASRCCQPISRARAPPGRRAFW